MNPTPHPAQRQQGHLAPGTPRPASNTNVLRPERDSRPPRRDTRPQRPAREEDRRPRIEVQAHQGLCSVEEVNALRACTMYGTRPFANLIAAGYAKKNPESEDWYLTDGGFERIREFTIRNATRNATF
jgi:hypothetical protein